LGAAAFGVTASSGTTMSYQWYYNGNSIPGATANIFIILTVLGSDSGTYCVKVTNAGGTVTSSNATLNVVSPPGITTQPQSQVATQGQNVSFSVVASGTSPFTYQWYFNGSSLGNSHGARTATLSVPGVTTENSGYYYVVVANAGGSVTSGAGTLIVYVPVAIQTQPQNQTVPQGGATSFWVVASGSSPLTYQWNFNGSPISGATSSSLTFANAQPSQAGNYAVVLSNPAGSVTSAAATLTVNVPAGITTQPQSRLVPKGQNVLFSVVASGTAPLDYHWYFNGSDLGGAGNNASISVNNAQTNNVGSYVVVVTNNWGSVTSGVASLILQGSSGMSSTGFGFQFSVPAGHTYIVLASGDFVHWVPISTNTAVTSSVAFTDAEATNHQARFYRVVVW